MESTQRVWLITGADKGLGAATARSALEQGDLVVVTVLDREGLHPLAAEFPDRFRSFHLDMRDTAKIAEVALRAQDAFGRIDILVNNAGYGLLSVAETTSPELYRPLFEVLFFALVEMTHAVLPGMRTRKSGHIINLSSVAGFGVGPGFSFYGAAKFAVEGYSEGLASEVRDLGIAVTIVEPGGFRSDFAGSSLANAQIAIADYEPVSRYIDTYSSERHGAQPNDPAMFGPAILRLVNADTPPCGWRWGRMPWISSATRWSLSLPTSIVGRMFRKAPQCRQQSHEFAFAATPRSVFPRPAVPASERTRKARGTIDHDKENGRPPRADS